MKKLNFFFLLIVIIQIVSCKSNIQLGQPEILTATYEIKTHSEFERGYDIFMVIDKLPESFAIKGIVLKNKLFENVHFTNMTENEIFIEQYFPIQSKMIHNFSAPKPDNRTDGIIFEIEGKEIYKEINFKLK